MPVIFRFASSVTSGLFAFAGDKGGTRLPEKHGPWLSEGRIQPGEMLPHRFARDAIEAAIDDHGYQLWRKKKPGDARAQQGK